VNNFLANFLEPVAYLIYLVALVRVVKLYRRKHEIVLLVYYAFATAMMLLASVIAFRYKGSSKLISGLLIDIKTAIPSKDPNDNNWVYNLFFAITICVLSYFFYQVVVTVRKKVLVGVVFLMNASLFIVYIFFIQTINNYIPVIKAFAFISIVLYCLLYFHTVLTNVNEDTVFVKFEYWLISSYTLYFLSGFFIILLYTYAHELQRAAIWSILNVLLLISALVTLGGTFYLERKLAT
jgi:hypothetical protein